ncbi:MAG: diaminopimelate epimerase [Candidatus Omnitrophota bacterium]
MKDGIPFYKIAASGNDFIVIDNRKRVITKPKSFARKVCAFHTGIGADGLLLLENSRFGQFKMRIINSDGSEAEACGNGFRCIALFAREIMDLSKSFRFESLAGMVYAKVDGSRVRVQLPQPKGLELDRKLDIGGETLGYCFINTGVPHAVIFTKKLKRLDLNCLAPKIRYHRRFAPKGTNVNFVEVQSHHEIHVRTYERGVEAETMACGTGSTASAIVSSLKGFTRPPVRVITHGGEVLIIDFKNHDFEASEVTLEGEVNIVFEGKLLDF